MKSFSSSKDREFETCQYSIEREEYGSIISPLRSKFNFKFDYLLPLAKFFLSLRIPLTYHGHTNHDALVTFIVDRVGRDAQ